MPVPTRGSRDLAPIKLRGDLSRRLAGKFIKHRAQLLGALNRVLTSLGAVGSKAA
jgi:hypothetical protein